HGSPSHSHCTANLRTHYYCNRAPAHFVQPTSLAMLTGIRPTGGATDDDRAALTSRLQYWRIQMPSKYLGPSSGNCWHIGDQDAGRTRRGPQAERAHSL